MRKTKIICTIGPSSDSPEMLRKLIETGMDVMRLNFSHGDHAEHGERIRIAKRIRAEIGVPLGILMDTSGPEIRIGKFKQAPVTLCQGQTFTLYTQPCEGDETGVCITYPGLVKDVRAGSTILLSDGLIELTAESVSDTEIRCRVMNPGVLANRQGINVPGVTVSLPSITEKDKSDILFGIEQNIDFIAASFVRKATDILEIRQLLDSNNGSHIQIIAKIECQAAITNFDEILAVADGIMVARGDLGVEIPIERVPVVQKALIHKCRLAGKPVITATQMLDSMIRHPRPTRAEVNDVANTILDGSDAIMLSGETASGKYPVEVLDTMARITASTEGSYRHSYDQENAGISGGSITNAVSHACYSIAADLNASAIITATKGGYTARMVAKCRPQCAIYAPTIEETTYHQLSLVWGVRPLMSTPVFHTDEMIEVSVDLVAAQGFVKPGDQVVITAGIPSGRCGSTNLIKVHVVGEVLVRGRGIGTQAVSGPTCTVHSATDAAEKFKDGCVLVTATGDNTLIPFMKRAAAVITEDGDITSHAAMIGLTFNIPIILGVHNAMKLLQDDVVVTVDPLSGTAYTGR